MVNADVLFQWEIMSGREKEKFLSGIQGRL